MSTTGARGARPALGAAVADLILPLRCGGCDTPGQRWCADCAASLARAPGPRRWRPTPAPPGLPPVWAVLPYTGAVRSALVNWKDHGRRDLRRVLAPVLTESLLAGLQHLAHLGEDPARALVVPAPSAAAATRRRGDRPLHDLTRGALRPLPAGVRPHLAGLLRLARPVADQAGLDSAARAANLAGAMGVRPPAGGLPPGVACVLVDDVITTGATLAEAARVLSGAGAGRVVAVTLAATHRRPARHAGRG